MLIVGHIHPEGTSAGSPIHPDSGLYSAEDGRIGNITTDFIFANGTTTARHRSYLFYSTNTTTRQQWVYPRMDKCDGTEPSIAELLAGHDSRNFDYVKQLGGNTQQAMSIDSELKVGGISEVGGKKLEGKNGFWYLDGELVTDIEGLLAQISVDDAAVREEMGR